MKIKSVPDKQKLTNRLNRLEGQVRGINRMIAEERDCGEVLQQFSALRAALQKTIAAYQQQVVNDCLLADGVDDATRRKLAVEMIDIINKV